ncbi:helix-turn-helix domain-containing protein [Bradyrhizobium elkanii]
MAEQHDILWGIMEDARLSAAAKCVATVLLLKFRNQDTKVCNPSFSTIAKCVGRKRRSVIDAVNELKEMGWVQWTGTLGGSTENTNQFGFSPQPVQQTAPVQDTTPVQCSADTGAAERTAPVQYTAHEPSIKPSKNQEERERARATLIPDDFKLDDQTYNWALGKLGSVDAVDRSVFRLVNHSRDKGTLSQNWQAKARNWIDRDAVDRPPDRPVIVDKGSADTDKAWNDILLTYVRTGNWTRHVDQFGPDPSSPACRAPRHLLIKHGIIREDAA